MPASVALRICAIHYNASKEITISNRSVGKFLNDEEKLIVDCIRHKRNLEEVYRTFFDERGDPPSIQTESEPTVTTVEVKAVL